MLTGPDASHNGTQVGVLNSTQSSGSLGRESQNSVGHMLYVQVSDESGIGWPWLSLEIWESLAREALLALGLLGPLELSVAFVREDRIAELNERYRGKQGPTDVLSFPMDDLSVLSEDLSDAGPKAPAASPSTPGTSASPPAAGASISGGPLMLGDVVIAPAVAARQAVEHSSTPQEETALLLVHGILHLLGMDHEDPEEAQEMEAKEEEILQELYRSQLWRGWSTSSG